MSLFSLDSRTEMEPVATESRTCRPAFQDRPQRPTASEGRRTLSRRELLWTFGGGLGGIAPASILGRDGLLGAR